MLKGFVRANVAVAACALLALAGCGDGGDSDAEALTKAQFTKKAASICESSAKERVKIISEIVQTSDPKADIQLQQEKVIRKAMPTYEKAAQQIDELGAPKGDEEKVEALVEAMEEAAERSRANPQTAMTTNIFFEKANELLEGYGLQGCVI